MRTIKRFVLFTAIAPIAILVLRLFALVTEVLQIRHPSATGIVAAIGGAVFLGIVFFILRLLEPRLVLCFPDTCGRRNIVFTGRSSKSLRNNLMSLDSDKPSSGEVEKFKDNALPYLEDFKSSLEKYMTTTRPFQYIFSGSVQERFSFPVMMMTASRWVCGLCPSYDYNGLTSDLDVMFFSTEHKASFAGQEDIFVEYLVPENEGFTGYAKLTQLTPGFTERVLSSTLVMRRAKEAILNASVINLPGTKLNICSKVKLHSKGPTIKLHILPVFEADITVSVQCPEWPAKSDWGNRPRFWPSIADVHRIMSLGCHLVAKPAPSDKDKTSWRFSFSLAEVELSKLVPDTARKCFMAMKIILKDHLQPVWPAIKSYHLKTIFLNTLEKLPVGFWVENNIEECFQTLLSELCDAFLLRNCRHHWFSSINLFGGKGSSCFVSNAKRFQILGNKVERIMCDPAPFIFDDGTCCLSL
ncbi:uncharacterized protein LOC111344563 [Stylophora pistillata]|uniref:Protein mab-21-like n=1 Tax=Stylophora pistillata TaxID=50429 RepID=A0A2B4REB1_STYPI|nr:uncharacterized protein LOC111344563 [Stylophora pistillata]PFX14615.1 Protein mab-21-like [Stylophora pistillata]